MRCFPGGVSAAPDQIHQSSAVVEDATGQPYAEGAQQGIGGHCKGSVGFAEGFMHTEVTPIQTCSRPPTDRNGKAVLI